MSFCRHGLWPSLSNRVRVLGTVKCSVVQVCSCRGQTAFIWFTFHFLHVSIDFVFCPLWLCVQSMTDMVGGVYSVPVQRPALRSSWRSTQSNGVNFWLGGSLSAGTHGGCCRMLCMLLPLLFINNNNNNILAYIIYRHYIRDFRGARSRCHDLL